MFSLEDSRKPISETVSLNDQNPSREAQEKRNRFRRISCAFNIDTACVEIKYVDGSMIAIDCTLVDAEVARNMFESSELEWLVSRLWLFAQLIVPY